MTLTQMEYIVAVDAFRSFAKAALHCNVTQPTLSTQVKKLEDELGVQLFDRSKKPVLTTEIGTVVVNQARKALQEARQVQELIDLEKGLMKGELRIGIIPTLSPYLLPLFILKFMHQYPEVEVVIEELMSEQIIQRLETDQLDAGILVTPLHRNGLVEKPLFYELFVVYMSTNHPLSSRRTIDFDELDLSEMWLLKEGHCFRNQVINICREDLDELGPRLRFESGSLETLRRIVEQQYGYTLLPELATLDMDSAQYQHIRHFKNPQPVREVSLVLRRSQIKARLIEALETEILENVPEILKNPERGRRIEWMER